MDEQKLLTEAELLRALNVNVERTTVWHWRKTGMPHVKVGRAIRYNLSAVQAWLKSRSETGNEWPWSVWTWVPEGLNSSGVVMPAFWYEECRCRNQDAAENIARLFQQQLPGHHARVSMTKPDAPPETADRGAAAYPASEEG